MSHRKEYFQQIAKADPGRIVMHIHYFGMASLTGANGFIVGCFRATTGVSGHHISDSVNGQKYRFNAPEAATAQNQPLGA
jgi:hypothetical protein